MPLIVFRVILIYLTLINTVFGGFLVMLLNEPITAIKGIGEKKAQLLIIWEYLLLRILWSISQGIMRTGAMYAK